MRRTNTFAGLCIAASGLAVLAANMGAQSAPVVSSALQAMADAERAFARTALEKGIREAFVEFFADDSIGFYPTPMNAREFYRRQPPTPLTRRLEWEPRLGDVARSGELGWLTGPFTSRDTSSDASPRHGCYFSIWTRRPTTPDAAAAATSTPREEWKVLMDVGIGTPEPVTFEQGFAAVAEPRGRFVATSSATTTNDDLVAADRRFADRARRNPESAYREILTGVSRLHVPGRHPVVGPDAILAFVSTTKQSLDNTPEAGTVAKSGDLGFTRGAYGERSAGNPAGWKGYYVRMWKRVADGTWTLAVEVRNPLPPPK